MNDSIPQEQTEDALAVQTPEVVTELPGKRLRETREAARLSREEVGHHLRLDPTLIRALEEDDYGKLPSPAYICGYLRSYARLLKLDEREIVNAYSKGQVISSALIPENINILRGKKVNYAAFKWIGILLLIAALIGVGLWLLDRPEILERFGSETRTSAESGNTQRPVVQDEESVPMAIVDAIRDAKEAGPALVPEEPVQQQADTSTPVEPARDAVADVPATVPASESPVETSTGAILRLHYRDDSWTEIMDRDANRVVYRLVRRGADLTVDAEPPFTILLGNAPGVDIYFRDELFDHSRFHRNEIAYFRIDQ